MLRHPDVRLYKNLEGNSFEDISKMKNHAVRRGGLEGTIITKPIITGSYFELIDSWYYTRITVAPSGESVGLKP